MVSIKHLPTYQKATGSIPSRLLQLLQTHSHRSTESRHIARCSARTTAVFARVWREHLLCAPPSSIAFTLTDHCPSLAQLCDFVCSWPILVSVCTMVRFLLFARNGSKTRHSVRACSDPFSAWTVRNRRSKNRGLGSRYPRSSSLLSL